jgi:hypothetical protein
MHQLKPENKRGKKQDKKQKQKITGSVHEDNVLSYKAHVNSSKGIENM